MKPPLLKKILNEIWQLGWKKHRSRLQHANACRSIKKGLRQFNKKDNQARLADL